MAQKTTQEELDTLFLGIDTESLWGHWNTMSIYSNGHFPVEYAPEYERIFLFHSPSIIGQGFAYKIDDYAQIP